jgi:hypothetical protein
MHIYILFGCNSKYTISTIRNDVSENKKKIICKYSAQNNVKYLWKVKAVDSFPETLDSISE